MTGRLTAVLLGLLIAGAIAWAHWPHKPLSDDTNATRVVVRKSARALELYDGSQLIRSYRVSLGSNAVGPKEQEGDGRTPEGEYVVDYHKPDSSFHRALHISYPSPTDIAAARARGVEPGGFIMVHGLKNGLGFIGRLHTLVDWTDGCVAVTNPEAEEISRVVADGTPIQIQP